MPASPRFDDIDLMEKVVLPIANLRHTLEAQLEVGNTVDLEQFLLGLNAIQSNASALHIRLQAPGTGEVPEAGVRKLPEILQGLSAECSPDKRPTELIS